MYKLATDDPQEGVAYLLDAASMYLSFDEEGSSTNPDLFAGFELALGSLLSADEQPAALILKEACAGSKQ